MSGRARFDHCAVDLSKPGDARFEITRVRVGRRLSCGKPRE
jgi:hypothetical protein